MTPPILTPPRPEWLAWQRDSYIGPIGIFASIDGMPHATGVLTRSGGAIPAAHAPVLPPRTQLELQDSATTTLREQQIRSMEQIAGFTMFEGQRKMLVHLAATRGAVIAAEVGVGKTLLAIGLIQLLKPKRCLVIAPQGVIAPSRKKGEDGTRYDASQWQREFDRFAPWIAPRYFDRSRYIEDGVTLTYMQDALLNDGGWLSLVRPDEFDMIVVDEAHLLADPDTKMGQALYRMQPKLRFALTATPMPNHPNDADALCQWVRPDVAVPSMRYVHGETCDSAFACRLRHAIAPIRKIDVRPDMPPLSIVLHEVEPEAGFFERYDAELSKIRDARSCGSVRRMQVSGLRGVCAESTAKAQAVIERLWKLPHALCVSARTAQTDMLLEGYRKGWLKAIKPAIGRIDSTSDAKVHGAVSAAFQRGTLDALFMGIKCAYGHSFPNESVIVIASLEWCHGSLEQALGRVYRVNSQKPVTAHVFILKGTIEREMFDRVCSKRSAIESVLFGSEYQPAKIVTADPVGAVGH